MGSTSYLEATIVTSAQFNKRHNSNMNHLKRLSLALLLVAFSSLAAAQRNNYLPCRIDQFQDFSGNRTGIYCSKLKASKVLNAFRRNADDVNSSIREINFGDMPDMTDAMMEEIFKIASVTLSDVDFIYIVNLAKVTKVPSAIRNFSKLQNIYIEWMDGIEILPAGSLTFSSQHLSEISVRHNNFLEVIEPGAFQGNFDEATIFLDRTLITTFDEAVFKPLLAESSVEINVHNNPIPCDCDLAWIIRDNREFFPRVLGNCLVENGNGTKTWFNNDQQVQDLTEALESC